MFACHRPLNPRLQKQSGGPPTTSVKARDRRTEKPYPAKMYCNAGPQKDMSRVCLTSFSSLLGGLCVSLRRITER